MTIVVALICIALIAFILWWFFGNHEKGQERATQKGSYQEVEVEVMGGYSPEVIVLKEGVPARIIFNRKDASSCLNQVVFPDFGIHDNLELNQKHVVEIKPDKAGEYGFACGMNMFHGKLIVEGKEH